MASRATASVAQAERPLHEDVPPLIISSFSTMKELPTFNGYVVDTRLREFRRVDPENGLEVISFASGEGQRLIHALDFLAFCCCDFRPAVVAEE